MEMSLNTTSFPHKQKKESCLFLRYRRVNELFVNAASTNKEELEIRRIGDLDEVALEKRQELANKMCNHLVKHDPNEERAGKFQLDLKTLMSSYRKLIVR
ncbi:hypothetical protein CDAR_58741 [Caerostris darwini]|uniref:Uncharacterized protein n=1 Tax=Caerostris darwini TaxID=1538125 RepID=A0AAV4S6J8_9ARAC|nr:hypothetical protein CDAR_58741 [Caerostris darwini]